MNRKPCTHDGECRMGTKKGNGYVARVCLAQRAVNERRRRAERRGTFTDGWEDEFGPAPKAVPDREWYDQVAVDNAVFGGLNRPLTRLEMEEYIRRTQHWTCAEAAVGVGFSEQHIRDLRSWYLTDKPARLKNSAA